ncbi:barstar family protein [Streptomyces sp. NPDC059567]|uniref:barstar family protein n=1 Tax=Streptomyces sp. NPDC059567 TaxID=3346867 RepID=UPI003675B79B
MAVFQEFYEGLRLPDYFGWNWDALSDCLRDLTWLPADRYVPIVEAANEALASDDSARQLLFKTLRQAGRRWSYTQRPEGIELSRLVVVLTCDGASLPDLRAQLGSCSEETAAS